MIMAHPEFERLHALAAGEAGIGRRAVATHVESCADCADTVHRMGQVLLVARSDFAPTPPDDALDRIMARRAAGDVVRLPSAEAMPARDTASRRRLAIIVAMLSGVSGLAVALPGSPIRHWLTTLIRPEAVQPMTPGADSTVATAQPATGVVLPLSTAGMWVSIDSAAPAVEIRVRLTDAAELAVHGEGVAAAAEFRPRTDGIGIVNPRGGVIRIEVPRQAARFVLRVGGASWLVKDGSSLRAIAPADTVNTEFHFIPRR